MGSAEVVEGPGPGVGPGVGVTSDGFGEGFTVGEMGPGGFGRRRMKPKTIAATTTTAAMPIQSLLGGVALPAAAWAEGRTAGGFASAGCGTAAAGIPVGGAISF